MIVLKRAIERHGFASGVAVGAVLAAVAIHAPYSAIASALSGPSYPQYAISAALGLAGVAIAVGRRRKVERKPDMPAMIERDVGKTLALTPTDWLERNGCFALRPEQDLMDHVTRKLAEGLRPSSRLPGKGWLRLFLRCVAAHGRGELVHGKRPIDVLADMRDAVAGAAIAPEKALDELAGIYDLVKPGCPEALALLEAMAGRHGTVETLAIGTLAAARSRGVLPSGTFAWMKSVDRPLWYALNNLGRRSFHVEGFAAIAHYQEEIEAGRALRGQHVHRAAQPLADMARQLLVPAGRNAA